MRDFGDAVAASVVDGFGIPDEHGEYVDVVYIDDEDDHSIRMPKSSAAILAFKLAELNLSERIVEIHNPAPNQPFFIIQSRMDPWRHYAWCQKMVNVAREKGGTFCRFSSDDHDPYRVILEAWKKMPGEDEEQGPVRWNYVQPARI